MKIAAQPGLPFELSKKLDLLKKKLKEKQTILIAFSGGTDSAFLTAVATEVLGDLSLAVTIDSPLIPRKELNLAKAFAEQFNIRHKIVKLDLLQHQKILANDPDRCYYCKVVILEKLLDIAESEGITTVADGANSDDLDDYRPGNRAAIEKQIYRPLMDLKFT